MNRAWLVIGGNMGDRASMLASAREKIDAHAGRIIAVSGIYETDAWGNTDQPNFYNQALEIATPLNARQLIRRTLKIEKQLGRIRKEKYGPRSIDIDIIFFNHEVHQYDLLKLPHPEMSNRRFVLVPLAEIAGDYRHPVLQKTVKELLEDCTDELAVYKIFPV